MIDRWLSALEQRHLADLTFREVARAVRALSSSYVERRDRLAARGALDTRGKRAAYALYYGPLHFLTVSRIVAALELDAARIGHILDVGCGAGAGGAAWAARLTPTARVTGVDEHPWAAEEAAFTYRLFGLNARSRVGDASRITFAADVDAAIAAWVINELDTPQRNRLLDRFLAAASSGRTILVVEPIARRTAPWWDEWAQAFVALGGRADEWRFPVDLPDLLRRVDRAAGLRHNELTARSLSYAPE